MKTVDPSPRFEILTPGTEHVEGLAVVHVQGWRDAYGGVLPERFYDDTTLQRRRRSWARTLENPQPDRFVIRAAVADGHVVGFCFVGPARGESPARNVELYSMYVLAAWYGSGVAPALLTASLGDRPAQLWVAQQNPRAIAFYRKHGFDLDGTDKVDPDLNDLVEVRMVR